MASYVAFSEAEVLVSDDVFWPIRLIFIDVFQFKLTKIVLKLMLLSTTVVVVLQTVILLQVFDGVFFIKYYMTYVGSIFIWFVLYFISAVEKFVSAGMQNLHIWDLNNTGSVVKKAISTEVFCENRFAVVTALLSVLTGITYAFPQKNDKDFFLPIVMFEKFFPRFEPLLVFVYRINYFILPLIMMAPFHMVIYYCGHARAQFYMFVECLRNLNHGYEDANILKLVRDDKYQKEITRRLKFCIKRHIHIYSTCNKSLRNLHSYIFPFAVSGALFAMGLVIYAVSFQSSLKGNYLRVVSGGVAYLFTFIHMVWAGQMCENVTSQTFEALKQTKWYYWNIQNKKMFLMFLLNGEKVFRLQYSQNVAVNNELGVSILKSIFSMVTFLARLKIKYYLNNN